MGETRCQIVIIEGNITYGILETFARHNPDVNVHHLEGAVQASCQGILHASLYFQARQDYDRLTEKYTQPIIDIHKAIAKDLDLKIKYSTEKRAQKVVDKHTKDLQYAIRKVNELFD